MTQKEPPASNTLLLDIYQTLGKVEAQLEFVIQEQTRANEARSSILQSQAEIVRRMDDFDGGTKANFEGGLKPKLSDFATVKAQMAVAVLVFVGGIQLAIYAISNIGQIVAFFRDLWK